MEKTHKALIPPSSFLSSILLFLFIGGVYAIPTASCSSSSSSSSNDCNLYEGSWIRDASYPLYDSNCPFSEGWDCRSYGRPDSEYLKYKWKPRDCELPRFDGIDFLRRMKGKSLMFVGDSLSFNMWLSLNCMLYGVDPHAKTSFIKQGSLYNRTFQDYGLSVMYHHTWFLVDVEDRVLKLDSIKDGNRQWQGVDLLIFNTGHWWGHRGKAQAQPWDYIQVGNKTYKDMNRFKAMMIGLSTWSKWIDSHIDPSTTDVYYQGYSPTHFRAREWGGAAGKSCKEEVVPLPGSTYPTPLPIEVDAVGSLLGKMEKSVEFLNVTLLSQLRKDGHRSIYSNMPYRNDCSHWCVAGVPDTWNELLYAKLKRG